MATVSVIVPIYNSIKYLNQCIESVTEQTYCDLEIILVDDGSNDGSSKLCDKWAERDKRIIVIHKTNGGAGSAVKIGITLASSPFCVFADSDDWMKNNLVEDLYGYMTEYDADGVRGGYTIYKDETEILSGVKKFHVYSRNEIDRILNEFYRKKGNIVETWSNSRCSKMYRTELLRKILDVYNESITIGEDLELNLLYLEKAQCLVMVPDNYNYCIRKHEDSVTGGFSYTAPQKYLDFEKEMYRLASLAGRREDAILPLLDSMMTGLMIEHLKDANSYKIKKKHMLYMRMFFKKNITAEKGYDAKHYLIKSGFVLYNWKIIYVVLHLYTCLIKKRM